MRSEEMKSTDLNLDELLSFSPHGDPIHFGPLRIVLMDVGALGLLRKELIENLGTSGARLLLSRFGFAQGWHAAESLAAIPWDTRDEWHDAGIHLHVLLGLASAAETTEGRGEGIETLKATWKDSYEAEQHLLQVGRSDEPVCWTLTGFVSGYLSRVHDRDIHARETRCRARGDSVCHVAARPTEEWPDLGEDDALLFTGESFHSALDNVTEALKNAERSLRRHVRQIRSGSEAVDDPSGIVAASDGMKRTLDLARRVARVDSSVLITGESGVGKERIARLIHEESERAARPFIAVNCAAVTESLLESELFGHVRGSFTGATQDRVGLFEAAHHGTIFLDEIGEIAQSIQVKLLRVLQEQEIRRVGESQTRKIDARVIAATNRDLADDVASSRFRDDLYYRLRVIELRIPPLRDRRQDILPIARRVLSQLSRKLQREISGFTPAAADLLLRYPWPGNVRELQNAVEHALVLTQGPRIDEHDLPEEVRVRATHTFSLDMTRTLAEVERDYILAALEANRGNQRRTAEKLGIGSATLYRRLRSYGVPQGKSDNEG
jgi:two-component system, NtrC family, response regulator HydG